MSFPGEYRGASFIGLLRANHPELVPKLEVGAVEDRLVHGTTICAVEFEGGVLLGGDRRATMGGQVIMNEDVTKVFRVDDYSAIAIAGTFGPSVKMARLFQVELEHYEKVEGVELTADGKANKLSLMIEMNFPAAMQGLMVMPLYVGYDRDTEKGMIYEYDITGGMFSTSSQESFACSGSGGERARATFEHFYRHGMSRDEAIGLIEKALAFASKRDTATGPGNYIIMSAMADGIETVRGEPTE